MNSHYTTKLTALTEWEALRTTERTYSREDGHL